MTKVMFRGLLASWLLLAAAVSLARAAEPEVPKTYVVLVGISHYADKQIEARPHAEDDVKALYDLFISPGVVGADKDHVRLLLGSEDKERNSQKATRENIVKELRWLRDNARQDDLVIFAFIGQGGTLSDQGERPCYFAIDSTVKGRDKNAIAAADIAQELDKLRSQRFCAFLDTTFRGFTLGDKPAPEPNIGENWYKEFLSTAGKEEKDASAPGRVLFLASLGQNPSPDSDNHGVFTQVLLKGIGGEADKEGYEPDGLITVDELAEFFQKDILELDRQQLKPTDERKLPDPTVFGRRATHFVVAKNPKVVAKVHERLEKLDKLAEGKQLSAVEIQEGRELLSRMPRLKSQQSLRKAYQQLVDGSLSVDKFETERQRISEQAKLKRAAAMEFAKTVMEASTLLRDHYVKELNQGQMIDWAIRGIYRSLEEKLPQEIADRLAKVKDMRERELIDLLADARERLGAREDLADHKDVDMALRRMTVHLDPYTTYWDPETVRRLESDIRGNFTGIGIQIRKNTARDMLMVATPLRDSPAHKAGLQTGDIITQITTLVDSKGKPLAKPETVSTKGLSMNDAVKKILGPRGTPVKLTVEREGVDKPLDFTIRRNRIEVESVLGFRRKSETNDWEYLIDPKDKIAYVRLTSFQESTAADLEKLMTQLQKQKIKGLILDLRHNPGGLLKSAVAISDMYIDDGLIVSIRPRSGPETKYSGFHEGSYLDFPMVCLVNGGSASGSEIVAACLQDHKRAIIIGERSYGKGSVQNIEPFADGEMKFTTASFWRPNGKNLNKSSTAGKEDEDWGVRPDKGYEVKLSRKEQEELLEHEEDVKVIPRSDRPAVQAKSDFKDRQLDKALEYLHEQIQKVARVESKK